MITELTTGDLVEIETFINEMWRAGKSTKLGDGSFETFKRAYERGKGAEVAVRRFLARGGVECSVDFDVYEGCDDTDLSPLSVEVKQCPSHGSWVAIPMGKFDNIPDDHLIVQVRTHSSDEYEVCGWAYQDDLYRIEEGETPFTQFEDNMCLPIEELRTDWREFVTVASDGNQSYERFTFTE